MKENIVKALKLAVLVMIGCICVEVAEFGFGNFMLIATLYGFGGAVVDALAICLAVFIAFKCVERIIPVWFSIIR